MKTREIKTNKGITLIALVITIIVLLILAGVTIATLTGDNGILTKANDSKSETAKATAKEKVQTEVMASYGTDGKIDLDQLNKNLQNISGIKYNGSAISDSNKITNLPATVTVDGYNVTIEANGTTTASGTDTPVTPPTGGTITITDAKKDEMKNKTENSDLTVTDGTVTIPAGFKVAEDSGTTIDEGIVIEDSKQNQFVWVPVRQESFESEFVRREGYTNGNLQKLLSKCGESDATGTNDKVTETATTQQEAKDMYKSVKANGGFYIGRYEAGKDTNGKVVVQKNANVYNNVYWSSTEAMQESETATTGGAVELSRNFAKENNYKTVQSTLIYGVQWDAVMNWMKDVENSSATSTDKKYIIDSTGMGWYDGVSGNSEHKTGIDLNGESNGILFNINKMGPVETATTAFGQGISVTPIQQITAVSAVVNGGNLYKPYIVKSLMNESGALLDYNEKVLVKKVISKDTSSLVRFTLESVVANGTGRNAYIENYRVGGKTGTAQKVVDGKYSSSSYILSFVGFMPADNPKIVIYVAIDGAKNVTQYGGTASAPVAKSILTSAIDILGIKSSKEGMPKEYNYLDKKYTYVQDVTGKSLEEAKKTLKGFKIELSGNGEKVFYQSPEVGTYVEEGSTVMLMLK